VSTGTHSATARRASRVTGYAYPPHQACLLHRPQRGNGLVRYLPHGAELDVVALDQVDVVDAESLHAVAHAAGDALGGEVEDIVAVPANLGGQHVTGPIDAARRLARHGLGSGQPVIRRDVEDVDPGVEGGVHGGDTVQLGEGAADPAERRCAEPQF
jgi:hypothetical protein